MNSQKNTAHQSSAIDVEKMVTPVLGGLYNWKKPEQAISSGNTNHTWHEISPITSVSSTVFNGNNNFVDFHVPAHLKYLDRMYFEITLANGSSDTNCVFASAPCNLISRCEVRNNGNIKDTRIDRDSFLNHVLYKDIHELQRQEVNSAIDPTSYALDTTYGTVAFGGSRTWRISLKCVLNGLPVSIINEQVVVRCYSQNVSNLLASGTASDLTCSSFKLYIQELDCSDSKLKQLSMKNLDFRCVVPKHETFQLSLSSGSTASHTLTNFSESDLYSHIVVMIQSTTQTGANIDQALDNASSIWLEDQSGQSLTNGIQWTNTQLLYDVYPEKFPNLLSQTSNKAVYVIDCPSEDPVGAYHKGTVQGAKTAKRNMKLMITASATATRIVDVIMYTYKHVRIEKGQMKVY